MNRYDRQIKLPEIGVEGQKKLGQAAVLCIGAGGLGSPALLYLVAAGIGKIGIIDGDHVDMSNLQRQVLFTMDDIGRSKAKSAAQRLRALNPDIKIEAYAENLTDINAEKLFELYDVILDGTDNFETKYLINDAAVKFNKPWVYGAIQGFLGQVSVFNFEAGPCYRCLFPDKPTERILNCAEAGVIGAVAGMVGVTQALQVVQILVGHKSFNTLSGRLWSIGMLDMSVSELNILNDLNCPVCSKKSEEIKLSHNNQMCSINGNEIDVDELSSLKDYIHIDVREQDEWDRGHIDGAILWPLSKIAGGQMPDVPKDSLVVLQCQKGMRSLQALQVMRVYGFENTVSLKGGYEAYIRRQKL